MSSCAEHKNVEIKYRGESMGTSWTVKVNSEQGYSADLAAQIQAALSQVDSLMSNWIETSDISRFNQSELNTCTDISEQTERVVLVSQKVQEFSDDAFNVSLSPLIELWGFGTSLRDADSPTPEELEETLTLIAGDTFSLVDQQLCKADIPVEINLSALAKGFAVDQVAEVLDLQGFTNYLIEVGGELRASGFNGRGQYWTVGIERPTDQLGVTTVQAALTLIDQSVATSGDYRNFYRADDTRYSHILDPTTGYPVTHDTASVTVLAERAVVADAWATALLVLGAERGMDIADQQGLAALMIRRTNDGYQVSTSNAWPVN